MFSRERAYRFDNFSLAVCSDRLICLWAILHANPGKKKPYIVIHFGHGADRRARISSNMFLINRDGWRQARNFIHVRFVLHIHELPRVGIERLGIAALAFGINRIKRQAGLSEPERPVMTVNLFLGILTETFLRLWTRAFFIAIKLCDINDKFEIRISKLKQIQILNFKIFMIDYCFEFRISCSNLFENNFIPNFFIHHSLNFRLIDKIRRCTAHAQLLAIGEVVVNIGLIFLLSKHWVKAGSAKPTLGMLKEVGFLQGFGFKKTLIIFPKFSLALSTSRAAFAAFMLFG